MIPRRLAPLLLAAALLLGCTREPSAPPPTATAASATATVTVTATPPFPNPLFFPTPTPTPTPGPTYVEVATGVASTTPPNTEFPKPAPLRTEREVDPGQLPAGAYRGVLDPTGRYLAYSVPHPSGSPLSFQGIIREISTGKEWKVEEHLASCSCDGSSVDPGPLWSSSGRFVAFGTGNWREERERHVVVIEPAADRVTVLPKPAWLRADFLGEAPVWRPGYEVLTVGQEDGVYIYDAVARTSTHMSSGTWPRFVTRDLVQYDLPGRDNRSEETAFTDIWRGGEVARVPWVRSLPRPSIRYEEGRFALASQSIGPACTGVIVAHHALPSPSICIPGVHAPAWSPDGRVLAFSRVDGPSSRSVVLFDPATGIQRPIAERLPASRESDEYLSTWSTDGRYLRVERGSIGFGG